MTKNESVNYTTLSPDDIKDLPEELINELALTNSDYQAFKIVNIIKNNGGVISLDHLLIALYKQTGIVYKRKILTAKLYRMVNKGIIYNMPGERGLYLSKP